MAFALVVFLVLRFSPFASLKSFQNRQYSTRFYDRNGELLQIMSVDDGIRREWISIDDVPIEVQQIFIDAEDKNFYKHKGVDLAAIFRAFIQNVKNKRTVSGASTITMQLARIIVPRKNANVTVFDKIREAFIAIRLELILSKKEILELYLNNLPFGFRTEGIASATRNFYGQSLHSLSTEQIETLALIPRRPSQYISRVPSKESFKYPEKAQHFILWVKKQYQEQKKTIPPDLTLSIDINLTELVEYRLMQDVKRYENARVSDGAAFVIDAITGEILVWCGSTDFYNSKTGQIDGVLVKNQAGSSMKPFLYALALEKGFSPTSVLADVPSDFGSYEVYVPQNFNNRFNGPQLFRTCLASSLNIPAVSLLQDLGINDYLDLLFNLGFDSLKSQKNSVGLSLALGGGEVTLFELVRAFSVFARDGTVPILTWQKSKNIKDLDKAPIFSTVFKNDTSRIICDILSDKNARSLGFGFAKVFDIPYPGIFKTGTSNQYQNIVALGSTKRYTCGVWMGNITGETVIGETGSSIPAGVVRLILDELEEKNTLSEEELNFLQPGYYEKQKICTLSGMAPSRFCKSVTEEYVLKGSVQETCDWHYSQNGKISVKYPNEYQRWFGGKNINGSLDYSGKLHFFYPEDGSVFLYDGTMQKTKQQLRVDVIGGTEEFASLFINGEFWGDSPRPFSWYVPVEPGRHVFVVKSGKDEDKISVTIK